MKFWPDGFKTHPWACGYDWVITIIVIIVFFLLANVISKAEDVDPEKHQPGMTYVPVKCQDCTKQRKYRGNVTNNLTRATTPLQGVLRQSVTRTRMEEDLISSLHRFKNRFLPPKSL
ncbi:MAG TPA: hypothetical protein VEP90_23770 [Methylomirabilota bacterium]|nr:hypothetical protein [Methylomirabilota bacterium]